MTVLALVLGCAVATAALLVVLRPVLQRYALARPNARSSHKVPTPQGGGMAVVAVTLGVLALTRWLLPADAHAAPMEIATVFGGAIALAIASAVDDIRGLGPLPRFGLQIVVVGAMLAALPPEVRPLPFIPRAAELALLLFGGVWVVNLTNFMDGIDWMTVAEVVPLAAGLALVGALGALPPRATVAAVALAGAMIGFAPFNKPVARLFLGDVGSVPIGFLLVWLLVLLGGGGHLAAAILLPLYYLADATLTLLRRASRGERVWEAHRTHFYQRATDRGFTVTQIVARVFATNVCLVALAIVTVRWPSAVISMAALATGVGVVATLLTAMTRGPR